MTEQDKIRKALATFDPKKRATMMRLLAGTAFATPIVASYAIDTLTISKARATPPNGSGKPLP